MIGFYAARAVPGAVNLLLVSILGLRIPRADYVQFSVWLGLALGAGFLFFGWIAQAIARHANGKDDLLRESPRAFMVAAAGACALVFLTALFGFYSLRGADGILIVLGCCSCCFNGCFSIVSAALQARLRLVGYVAVEACRPLGSASGALLGVFLITPSATCAIAGFVIGQAVVCLGVLFWLRMYVVKAFLLDRDEGLAVRRNVIAVARYGLPISLWLGLNAAWPACDRSLLSLFFASREVGDYSLRYDLIVRSFTFLLLPLTLYSQPRIFKAFAYGDLAEVRAQISTSVKRQAAAGLLFTLALGVCAPLLAEVVPRLSGTSSLQILLLGATACVWQMALMCQKWLECYKRVWLMVGMLAICYGVAGCGVGLIVLPVLGVNAFLFGSLCGGVIYCSLCFCFGIYVLRDRAVGNEVLNA